MDMHWDTARYLDRHGFIIQRGQALIDLLNPQPGERILDLGCGTGDITRSIADRSARVTGVDASADMIAAARERFPELDFRQVDAAELPYESEFDAVFSHAVLHWVTRAGEAAGGMRRALRPGGRLLAEFGGHRNCATLEAGFGSALETVTGRAYRSPWYFPRLPEYTGLLEAHGFIVRAAWHFDLPTALEGADGLRQWVRQFLPQYLDGQDPGVCDAMLAVMEDRLRPSQWRDGAWWVDYRRLRVVAEAAG
jgi:trans-aconitate methyltransferase